MAKYKLTKNLGMLLLGIWLILYGLIPVLKLHFDGFPVKEDLLEAVKLLDAPPLRVAQYHLRQLFDRRDRPVR